MYWARSSLAGIIVGLLLAPTSQGDVAHLYLFNEIRGVTLPGGEPAGPSIDIGQRLVALTVADGGGLLAVFVDFNRGTTEPFFPPLYTLEGIGADGAIETIGEIALPVGEGAADLAFDEAGRLWLLTRDDAGLGFLYLLDPASASVERVVDSGRYLEAIAPAPGGLWALGERLFRLDPLDEDFVVAGPGPVANGYMTIDADADSDGNLWLIASHFVSDPPSRSLLILDPSSGELSTSDLDPSLMPGALAIRRTREGCVGSDTVLCLRGNRFQVELTWRDFSGRTGVGHAVPGRSAAAGLVWFFTPENWELLVKVVEACELNTHYWVLASASTNVEYTLRVVDTRSGEERSYTSPLGEASAAIVDTEAFAACPGG